MRFSLYGLYEYDNTIFDDVILPPGIDKQITLDTIMDLSGDLYVYYQIPSIAKRQITQWFTRHYHGFERMILTLTKDYNPIENTDAYEDEVVKPNTTKTNVTSGTDTASASGDDVVNTDMTYNNENTNQVSAFDSADFVNHDKSNGSNDANGDVTTTYGKTDTFTYGKTDTETNTGDTTRTLHRHGNIGTMKTVDIIWSELELRKYDLYKVIAQMFEDDILIQIY